MIGIAIPLIIILYDIDIMIMTMVVTMIMIVNLFFLREKGSTLSSKSGSAWKTC